MFLEGFTLLNSLISFAVTIVVEKYSFLNLSEQIHKILQL